MMRVGRADPRESSVATVDVLFSRTGLWVIKSRRSRAEEAGRSGQEMDRRGGRGFHMDYCCCLIVQAEWPEGRTSARQHPAICVYVVTLFHICRCIVAIFEAQAICDFLSVVDLHTLALVAYGVTAARVMVMWCDEVVTRCLAAWWIVDKHRKISHYFYPSWFCSERLQADRIAGNANRSNARWAEGVCVGLYSLFISCYMCRLCLITGFTVLVSICVCVSSGLSFLKCLSYWIHFHTADVCVCFTLSFWDTDQKIDMLKIKPAMTLSSYHTHAHTSHTPHIKVT